jgi:enamine deaminase RidA (YjgF/YER057c/UK114 family)
VIALRPEGKLLELGLELPASQVKAGNYVSCVQSGKLLFLSGCLSYDCTGKLGQDLTVEQGYEAAKMAILQGFTVLKTEVKELSRIKKFVKLLGFINCTMNFTQHAKVLNGASDLIHEVFGEEVGSHARTTIGAILPREFAVEIELVLEID